MELILILQIIPFVCIVAKINGAQHGIKGHCNLVPTDLKKIQTILPMACNKENLISLLLKVNFVTRVQLTCNKFALL